MTWTQDHWLDISKDDPASSHLTALTGKENALSFETIEGVEPLEPQFGVWPKQSVPTAIHAALFLPVDPSDDPAEQEELLTYAVLDGAKINGLAEALEQSGLAHCCLFSGDTFDAAKHVAPWLVRLEDGNDFTRKLFTAGPQTWQLWERKTGIFLRSSHEISALRAHLRRFTNVPDARGTAYIFRFWDPDWIGALLTAYFDDGFSRIFEKVHSVMALNGTSLNIYRGPAPIAQKRFVLSEAGTQRYGALRMERLSEQLVSHFSKIPEFSELPVSTLRQQIVRRVSFGVELGFSDGSDLFKLALGLGLSGDETLCAEQIRALYAHPCGSDSERHAAILAHASEPIAKAKRRAERLAVEAEVV